MVQRSQNGWVARSETSHFTRATVCGFGYWAANPDVAVVFGEFIERFDTEVEELTQPKLDDWSWADRNVRGSDTVVSNHGSATAIDLNALKHPRGVRNTFSTLKRHRMRTIKNSIVDKSGTPVLRLGLDYMHTPDDMHVEINADAAKVKEAADIIRKRNAPKPINPKETDMKLSDQVPLTPDAAATMGRPGVGEISLLHIALWGGPGAYADRAEFGNRLDKVDSSFEFLVRELTSQRELLEDLGRRLDAALTAAAAPPADAVPPHQG